jgi:HK97 gp10 family phage protein
MSAVIKVEVKYAKDLARNLRELWPDALDKGVQNAIHMIGERMLDTANRLVPVRTGYLRSTLALEQTGKWTFRLVARAPYAAFVEWGTGRMHAHLFMTQAVQMHTAEMWEEVENAAVATMHGGLL